MLTITKNDIVPAATSVNILQRYSSYTNGVFINLDKVLDYIIDATRELRLLNKDFQQMSGRAVTTRQKEVFEICHNRFNVPYEKMMDQGKLSLKSSIVTDLCVDPDLSEDAREYFKLMKEINNTATERSSLKQYLDLPLVRQLDHEGNRVVRARPTWNMLDTGRISASNPSFQNIKKSLIDIITWMPGQIYVEADSGQIEPRITYSHYVKDPVIKKMIEIYDDAYFGLLHYCLATVPELKTYYADVNSIKPMEITDEIREKRKQLKVLLLSVNYGGEEFANTIDIGPTFIQRVKNHKSRKLFQEECEKAVARGEDTCYTAFGSPIQPKENAKYKKNTKAWRGHLVRCFVNNPIQGTAADLMNTSVYFADKIIRERAKSPLTSIAGYVHDCGKFYVAEEDADLIDDLVSCMSYQVIDPIDESKWIKIPCDKKINGVEQC